MSSTTFVLHHVMRLTSALPVFRTILGLRGERVMSSCELKLGSRLGLESQSCWDCEHARALSSPSTALCVVCTPRNVKGLTFAAGFLPAVRGLHLPKWVKHLLR